MSYNIAESRQIAAKLTASYLVPSGTKILQSRQIPNLPLPLNWLPESDLMIYAGFQACPNSDNWFEFNCPACVLPAQTLPSAISNCKPRLKRRILNPSPGHLHTICTQCAPHISGSFPYPIRKNRLKRRTLAEVTPKKLF